MPLTELSLHLVEITGIELVLRVGLDDWLAIYGRSFFERAGVLFVMMCRRRRRGFGHDLYEGRRRRRRGGRGGDAVAHKGCRCVKGENHGGGELRAF
jgi:hypothetical protein